MKKNIIEERFEDKYMPIPETGCWIWLAAINEGGYGYFSAEGETIGAHIYSYIKEYGEIPEGYDLDHKCRVRCCVNPDHVEPVTRSVNLIRGYRSRGITPKPTYIKKPKRTHCRKGHPYSKENLYIYPKSSKRGCKICIRQSYERRQYGFILSEKLK